jgi:perosamine synthetase
VNKIEGLTMAKVPDYAENNHWMILLQIDIETYSADREGLMTLLEENGIQTRPAWAPIHFQEPYQDCQTYKVEKAIELVEISLCLPSSTNLENNQISEIINSFYFK